MKFVFRLEKLKKQRKIEQDMAQREYSEAQAAVQLQLGLIKKLYEESDLARLRSENLQKAGGTCAGALQQIDSFLDGQKIKIQSARYKARELMQVAEEKQEILLEKIQNFKILEKLKERKQEEFRKEKNRKLNKEIDDIVTMRFVAKGK